MRRTGVLFAAIGVLLVAGGARLAYIGGVQGDELRRRAVRQQTASRTIPAQRGEILDTLVRVLAGTIREPSLFVDAYLVDDVRFAAYSVAPVLGLDPAALEQMLTERREERFVWLKRRVSAEELEAYRRVVQGRRLRAFDVQYEYTRVYPHGQLAAHVLGFVGADLQGLAGVEQAFDGVLRGKPGKWAGTVDVSRRSVRSLAQDVEAAVDGATLVLTIDAYVQEVAEGALRKAVQKHKAAWGAVVVIDPQSGEVLAMAAVPDFDPAQAVPPGFGELSRTQQEEVQTRWRDRAVSDSYEPGSAFKPFIASSALEEGLTRIDEVFAINGPVHSFGRRTIHDTHPYGALAFHEIISKSSNIGMGLVGARCGMDRLYRYVRSFGFGDITGVGLPGEHTGLVQDFSRWNPSFSPQSVPIGQEIAVTPIQLATAFSVFCNGGVLLRPRIVRGVIGPDGETLADYSRPIAVRRVLSEATAETFRKEALAETVSSGTGKSAAVPGYQVFGKTGTAQIAQPEGHGYVSGSYVGTFIGGAPLERPRVVALVSIYRPTEAGYYGGVVAAPAVKEVLAATLAYMQVPPELSLEPDEPRGARPGRRAARPTPVRDAGAGDTGD